MPPGCSLGGISYMISNLIMVPGNGPEFGGFGDASVLKDVHSQFDVICL